MRVPPGSETPLWVCPPESAWAPCQILPLGSCLAPVTLQGPKARALPVGAPCRAPPLPAPGINPSFAQAGLSPRQWGFCPARPAVTFYLRLRNPLSTNRLGPQPEDSNSGKMKETPPGQMPPIPGPEPHRWGWGKLQALGIPFALSLTSLPPSPSLEASSAGQPLGEGRDRTTSICDWVTPCQGALGRESPRGSCPGRGCGGWALARTHTGAGPSAPSRVPGDRT